MRCDGPDSMVARLRAACRKSPEAILMEDGIFFGVELVVREEERKSKPERRT